MSHLNLVRAKVRSSSDSSVTSAFLPILMGQTASNTEISSLAQGRANAQPNSPVTLSPVCIEL